jgi:beta-lactamase class C
MCGGSRRTAFILNLSFRGSIIRGGFNMIKKLIILLSSLLSLTAAADQLPPQWISQKVDPFIKAQHLPGIAVAIYYQGKDYYYISGNTDSIHHQSITKDSIFELASISKVFTTTLLASAVQAGKLNLQDPMVKYLPALKSTSDRPIDKVTLLNLATHTASFPRQEQGFGVRLGDVPGLMQKLKQWQPNYPIGSAYVYSNISFGLLGSVVANAAQQPYDVLLKKQIADPLGMTHTCVTVPEQLLATQVQGYNNGSAVEHYVPHGFYGGGAVRSSAADMLAFMKANLGVQVDHASPQLLAAMKFSQQPQFKVNDRLTMGLGWERRYRENHLYISKNGGNPGFSTFIGFSPEQQFGVVVLINQNKAKATEFGNRLLTALSRIDQHE